MKTKWFLTLALLIGLLLAVAGSTELGLAQGPGGDEVQPQGDISTAATVSNKISYQGVLKEDGQPVTGSRDMTFRLYSDQSCSTQVGSDIVESGVEVTNGLFSVDLDVNQDDFNGQGLWLEASVEGTDLDCQEILPVPYALSLRPGAKVVHASTSVTETVLSVENTGLGIGVYVEGGSYGVRSSGYWGVSGQGTIGLLGSGIYGVWGESSSSIGHGVGGYNNAGGPAVFAGGSGIIKSLAETRLAINPFEIEGTDELTENGYLSFLHHWPGYTVIQNTFDAAFHSRTIYVPVHNLIQLFGSPLKLKSLEVCYKLADASSYIDQTAVYYVHSKGGREELIGDSVHRTSTTWNCYTVSSDPPLTIDGPMLVYFNLYFDGTGVAHEISIGRMIATLVEVE